VDDAGFCLNGGPLSGHSIEAMRSGAIAWHQQVSGSAETSPSPVVCRFRAFPDMPSKIGYGAC